jgi:long-chain acyl-CoA synthetase
MIKFPLQVPSNRPWLKKYSDGIPANLEYPEIPVYEILEQSATKYADKVALSFYGKEISYQELNELSDRFANALQHYGIKKGDRILFMLPTCTQFFIAYFGALKAGAITIPLNPLYTVKELEYFFEDAEPRMVITLDVFYEKTRQAAEVTPQIEKIIVTNLADYFSPIKRVVGKLLKKVPTDKTGDAEKFTDFIKIEAKYNKVDINPQEDLALIIYTSGTTGTAKGAMISHFNIVAANVNVSAWVGAEKKLTVIPCS